MLLYDTDWMRFELKIVFHKSLVSSVRLEKYKRKSTRLYDYYLQLLVLQVNISSQSGPVLSISWSPFGLVLSGS